MPDVEHIMKIPHDAHHRRAICAFPIAREAKQCASVVEKYDVRLRAEAVVLLTSEDVSHAAREELAHLSAALAAMMFASINEDATPCYSSNNTAHATSAPLLHRMRRSLLVLVNFTRSYVNMRLRNHIIPWYCECLSGATLRLLLSFLAIHSTGGQPRCLICPDR